MTCYRHTWEREQFEKADKMRNLEKAIELFKRCQDADSRVEMSLSYFEFNDFFNRAFVGGEDDTKTTTH